MGFAVDVEERVMAEQGRRIFPALRNVLLEGGVVECLRSVEVG